MYWEDVNHSDSTEWQPLNARVEDSEGVDHLISTRWMIRPRKIYKKKRTRQIVEFADSDDYRVKLKENEKRDEYLELAREVKKTVEHERNSDNNYNWCSWNSHQRIDQNYNIIMIGQNTEESPRDLRRLAVTQTPLRNHRLKLVWKMMICSDRDEAINPMWISWIVWPIKTIHSLTWTTFIRWYILIMSKPR